ncbi:hypothetical protein LEP1GSC016_2399 [Leptospira borgpetersenii serovar Hardjo-bovis str. Sponselee]|uniref:Uncharacterized protein n=1 Tax=Leptospira borgpetersenii serovar Hardjo-bovis str. Sponselee TaxID=1303729 RepID=M6C306_LEPBO|nr:hypothetical protein LBK6_06805 [Leptospira borgpetersenii serovar Hardjo]AMX61313.1 hypothetical protein LBK9_06830 [Leptospira borgpetersenii serovar Hardjo]AMX64558.1 hypothetical protein LBK30_06885 [Leptospira borgpetersenii serovar Hardjo]AMX67776.1 hypothetical protein LBHA_06750 [Leptospira borgpetersenii serovar Hardjo]EMJ83158.1 hypothetical protein LEP1GSC016_2399 [Leptospira borgpetersenii serovar Hardjo-bovis str. Sponselee]
MEFSFDASVLDSSLVFSMLKLFLTSLLFGFWTCVKANSSSFFSSVKKVSGLGTSFHKEMLNKL